MPSFATEVKNELARGSSKRKCCQNAELAALLRMGASMTIGARMNLGLNFTTENAAEVADVFKCFNNRTKPEDNTFTRGHFTRGVE